VTAIQFLNSFLRYALSKSAIRYEELAIDQEIAFTLKQQFDVASDLQRTLVRLRKSFYAEWIAAQSIDVAAHPVESAASFLCRNREDLFVTTVLQFANKIPSPKIPQDLLEACLVFARTRFQSIWMRAAAIGQSPLIQRRVPLVGVRPLISWAQIFNLLSHLFEEIRTITDRLFEGHGSIDNFIVILQTVFISANTDRIFKVFLVFEKTFFRQAEFVRVLEKATLNDWTQFFKMMLTTLAEDQPLLNRCISFDLSNSAFA
jgi:hypothetical protein